MRRAPSISRLVWLAILVSTMGIVSCMERDALLDVSHREIDFGSQLDRVTITVSNAGEDHALTAGVTTLEYQMTVDAEWLTVSPSSGTCEEAQENTHVVEVDRSLLLIGQNLGTISISSNGGARSIQVRAMRDVPVCSAPPTEPWNPAPGDVTIGVPVNADLIWSDGTSQCPGLTATYDIYFGATSPPPFHHDNGSSKTWDPGTLAYGTAYYWRIVAKDANGATSGSEWSFETAAVPCTAVPTAPSGPSPVNVGVGVSIDANLSWAGGTSQCPGLTATYDIYFGATSPPPFHHDNGSSKTWDPGTLAYGTAYYWRIVAKDANGATSGSEWSFETAPVPCTAAPTAPSGPSPVNVGVGVSIDANLSWTGGTSQCPGLTATYDIYFGATSPPPLHHDNGSSKTWDPGTLANATAYYWRIVAKDANGATSGSEWSFETAPAPCTAAPTAPSGPSPVNVAVGVPIDANLSWTGGTSQCPGLTATYDIYFGATSPPPLHHDNGSSKTWDPGTLANATTYYWQIVAKDANGSTPGAVWSFTTVDVVCTEAPTAVCTPSPGANSTLVPIDANVSWGCGVSTCPGLTAVYDVYFGTAPTPEFRTTTSASTWDPGVLEYSTTYYWQVVSNDANGATPGPVWSFVTEEPCLALPTAACNPTPTDGRVNVNENTNLAWQCGDSQCAGLVTTYDVYLGISPSLGSGDLLGNTASKTWNLERLLNGTTYYWQIVSKDANGGTAGPVWSFTTRP